MMPTITFIVKAEVERESGLFAGRDEISEAFQGQIEDAIESTDLGSLGANGDSVYNVSSVEIDAVDTNRKAGRDELMEYDDMVIADIPGDPELRKAVKALRAEVRMKVEEIRRLQKKLENATANREVGKTRVFQNDHGLDNIKTYFADGPYDEVNFQYGPNWDQKFSVGLKGERLSVRSSHGSVAIIPGGGNHVEIVEMER